LRKYFNTCAGVLVGCLRKVQKWSLTTIFDEYKKYSGDKGRILDQQFIELFDEKSITINEKYKPNWLK
jgi:tyrosine-protein phosphatase SIW14